MTSGDPAARFAIQLQARSLATIGLNEIVDFGDLAVLSPRKYSVRFDGWAVADEQGKATGAVSNVPDGTVREHRPDGMRKVLWLI